MCAQIVLHALDDIPLINVGDNISQMIIDHINRDAFALHAQDIIVVTSKIISKAEGRFVHLDDVVPGERAYEIAEVTKKDARIVEVILQESVDVVRTAPYVLVTEHRLGFVSANSGVDQSNTGRDDSWVLLLPENPDATAQQIRDDLKHHFGVDLAVVISDTHGRAFRLGNVGVAIGVSGLPALLDLRGSHDLFGREMVVSQMGYADLVASAAHLLSGEGDEARPVIIMRGVEFQKHDGKASDLYRPKEKDVFR